MSMTDNAWPRLTKQVYFPDRFVNVMKECMTAEFCRSSALDLLERYIFNEYDSDTARQHAIQFTLEDPNDPGYTYGTGRMFYQVVGNQGSLVVEIIIGGTVLRSATKSLVAKATLFVFPSYNAQLNLMQASHLDPAIWENSVALIANAIRDRLLTDSVKHKDADESDDPRVIADMLRNLQKK